MRIIAVLMLLCLTSCCWVKTCPPEETKGITALDCIISDCTIVQDSTIGVDFCNCGGILIQIIESKNESEDRLRPWSKRAPWDSRGEIYFKYGSLIWYNISHREL